MAKVKLIIESQTDDGVVHAIVNGVSYIYSGMDSGVFKARQKTYKYKPGQLLNWLKKNSKEAVKAAVERKKPTVKRKIPYNLTHVKIMLNRTKKLVEGKGYVVVMRKTTFEIKKCPKCGRPSMMGCFSKSKKAVIGICFHRFNPVKTKRCKFNKKWIVAADSPRLTANAV